MGITVTAAKYRGKPVVIESSDITEDRYGLSSGSVSYKVKPGGMPVIPLQHPDEPKLWLDRTRRQNSGAFWTVIAEYVGVLRSIQPTWEVSTNTSSEPIETHPNFMIWVCQDGTIPGDPTDLTTDMLYPYIRASFEHPNGENSIGAFKGFPASAPNDLPGVRNYLVGRQSLRKISYSSTKPSLTPPASINTPSGAPYAAPADRNWLYMGASIRVRGSGKIFEVTESWDMSGPRKWSPLIYIET